MDPPELLTTPPVRPPSGPPDGYPLIEPVIGWPVVMVTMEDNAKPLTSRFAARLPLLMVGIHTKVPVKRWRWSRSEGPYSSLRFIGSTGESVP